MKCILSPDRFLPKKKRKQSLILKTKPEIQGLYVKNIYHILV